MDTVNNNVNTDAGSVATNISWIKSDIKEIKDKLNLIVDVYATKVYVEERVKDIERSLDRIEATSNLWKWLSPTLAAITAGVIVFLITQYLANIHG